MSYDLSNLTDTFMQQLSLIKMDMDDNDNMNVCNATCSYLRKTTKKAYTVRDYCHRTGRYRGAAHHMRNINYVSNRYLPVFVHNLKRV